MDIQSSLLNGVSEQLAVGRDVTRPQGGARRAHLVGTAVALPPVHTLVEIAATFMASEDPLVARRRTPPRGTGTPGETSVDALQRARRLP